MLSDYYKLNGLNKLNLMEDIRCTPGNHIGATVCPRYGTGGFALMIKLCSYYEFVLMHSSPLTLHFMVPKKEAIITVLVPPQQLLSELTAALWDKPLLPPGGQR